MGQIVTVPKITITDDPEFGVLTRPDTIVTDWVVIAERETEFDIEIFR